MTSNKVKIAFVLPEALQRELKEKMTRDGYDLKGKSRWISEAIQRLFGLSNFADLVKLNDEMKGFEKAESVLVERTLKNQMNDAVVDIRQKYPTIEGVQSRILRTAIVQRLLFS
jgi:hypothetical protein